MIKIAILDSGVHKDHPAFAQESIFGYKITIGVGGKINICDNITDSIGHGTAIYDIIRNRAHNVEITNIKIFDERDSLLQEEFEAILEYILQNCHFDIINISMGIVRVTSTHKMQQICDRFFSQKTFVVSAFDNFGAISFPAALNRVIGVDVFSSHKNAVDTKILKNGIVNVACRSRYYRVAWLNPEYNIIKGTSFACAEVTATIANLLSHQDFYEVAHSLGMVKNEIGEGIYRSKLNFKISKAVVFPFNKESHAIAMNESMLDFDIVDYYSVRALGHIGKKISHAFSWIDNDKIIKDITELRWDEFDTLILGHTDYLEKLMQRDGLAQRLIEKALENDKNIYMFDEDVRYKNNRRVFTPIIDEQCCIQTNGKLFQTNVPVVCVCGTNSRQGKYSLQLEIRKKLLGAGYNVGQIGTEPSALLFGMDEVFHCGYNKNFSLPLEKIETFINQQLWSITEAGPDIILAGTQSSLLSYNSRNAINSSLRQQIVFDALKPDAIILCINPYDEISHIKRTVKVAEGLSGGKVVGVVCYPIDYTKKWSKSLMRKNRVSCEDERIIKWNIKANLNLETYMLDNEDELDLLIASFLDYLSA